MVSWYVYLVVFLFVHITGVLANLGLNVGGRRITVSLMHFSLHGKCEVSLLNYVEEKEARKEQIS